jgi:hypothetical protein
VSDNLLFVDVTSLLDECTGKDKVEAPLSDGALSRSGFMNLEFSFSFSFSILENKLA